MFRRLTQNVLLHEENELSNDEKKVNEILISPGPDLVVCDEGHLLKNDKTSLNDALSIIRTKRKIVLTGTPLQNNLNEYYCMVDFVKPNLLGNPKEFTNRFVNPIMNGQYMNSTECDIKVMKRRSHVLHKLLDSCIHRAGIKVLEKFLKPKEKFVLYVRLTELQVKLYKVYFNFAKSEKMPREAKNFSWQNRLIKASTIDPLIAKRNAVILYVAKRSALLQILYFTCSTKWLLATRNQK